jgi:tRNA nucleotidyltransferase (CCA-adding enzyme)
MNYTKALNNKIFQVISQASEELNVDSYVIGGFVRDLILKRLQKISILLL